jgi:hypothetical protein
MEIFMKNLILGLTFICSLSIHASDSFLGKSFITDRGEVIIQNEAAQEIYEMLEDSGAMRSSDVRLLSLGDELRSTKIYSPKLKFTCEKVIYYTKSNDSESSPHFSCSL